MLELTDSNKKELAYLIGAFIGDGYYARPDKYGHTRICFSSSDKEFVFKIKDIIKNIFSLDTGLSIDKLSLKNPSWRDHYRTSSRSLYRLLMAYLPDKNSVPSFVRGGSLQIKSGFLSGFFDAEGGVCISTIKSRNAIDRRLYCHNSNLRLLYEVKSYLKEMDIDSFIQNGKGAYSLNVWGYKNLVNFKNLIGFTINRKEEKLFEAICSYKVIRKKYRNMKLMLKNNMEAD